MSAGKATRPESPLADELRAIRREVRISQDELADLSDVGRTTIKAIERGEQRQPKPETLRLIATGAATNGAGELDEPRRHTYYSRLMQAAGYGTVQARDPGLVGSRLDDSGEPAPLSRRDQALAEIEILLQKIPDVSIALTDLARGAQEWDDEDAEFVRNRLRRLAEQFGRSQAAC